MLSAPLGVHNVKSLGCLRSFPNAFCQQLDGNYRINWNRPCLPLLWPTACQWGDIISMEMKVSTVRRTIRTWIVYGNHLPATTVCTHQAPCKFEYCLDQARINRSADNTCVALSLQTTWVKKTASVVHSEQGGPAKCCLEVLREDSASSYLFLSLSLPLPVYQTLPAQWLACPEGATNGAALAMDMLILARCFSEWLKARDIACSFILGHTLAGLLLSPHPHPHTVTIILHRAITHISQYNA